MSALSTVAGACSARRSSGAGGRRHATGLQGRGPPFRGDHRARRLLLPDTSSQAVAVALNRQEHERRSQPADHERRAYHREGNHPRRTPGRAGDGLRSPRSRSGGVAFVMLAPEAVQAGPRLLAGGA